MQYRIIPVTPFEQNCTLWWCEETREATVIDPGGDLPRILGEIERQRLTPTRILLTHGHVDHAGCAGELSTRLAIPIEGPHRDDAFLLQGITQQGMLFGLPPVEPFTPDRWLDQGDRVALGRLQLEVLHCPGHTPGHLVFFEPQSRLAQVGDVLFQGSIGRTDFPRGDYEQLIDSIRTRLWPLGNEVRFIPGHGPMSSFGEERRSNPFVADRRL